MAERKVLSKYFPPDFDPSKIKRVKRDPTKQQVVRLMAPFSMACKSCGEYIYKGRKFNARKEYTTEDYYGIKIFRFYIKCTRCSAEITFKTDPKHTDYEMEHGATRNYAPWRDTEERAAKEADPLAYFAEEERMRGEADAGGASSAASTSADPMATLEARQEESRREMQVLDALQDIRTRNARMDRVDTGDLVDRLASKRKRNEEDAAQQLSVEDLERIRAEEEDEQLVRKYFAKDARGGTSSSSIKRSVLEQEPEARHLLSDRARALLAPPSASAGSPSQQQQQQLPVKMTAPTTAAAAIEQEPSSTTPSSAPASAPTPPAPPVHAARSAAMAGMAAAAAKKKAGGKHKANALGVVQKPKARV